MSTAFRPVIGISMGDPNGIGPEIILKAFLLPGMQEQCRLLAVGDANVMRKAVPLAGGPVSIRAIGSPSEAHYAPGVLDVLDLADMPPEQAAYGQLSPAAGNAAYEAVVKLIALAMAGEVDATVSAPLNKEAMNLAGHHYSGHTEIYAHETRTKDYAMMLMHGNLRVAHVSTHVSLREACDRVKKERVLAVIRLTDRCLRELGFLQPRIGVAGLNPHAGEGGLFGREDIEEIAPAVEAARAEGLSVEGPIPPDTVFCKCNGGWYDAAVAMYHDQGHIPLKVVGFQWNETSKRWENVSGVNVTLGLPIIRVSVDHGTAFEIAGKGVASESSMADAINYAVQLAIGGCGHAEAVRLHSGASGGFYAPVGRGSHPGGRRRAGAPLLPCPGVPDGGKEGQG